MSFRGPSAQRLRDIAKAGNRFLDKNGLVMENEVEDGLNMRNILCHSTFISNSSDD